MSTTINCQAGICDPPPEHMAMVALSFQTSGPGPCQQAVIGLRELVRRELDADIAEIDPDTAGTATTPTLESSESRPATTPPI